MTIPSHKMSDGNSQTFYQCIFTEMTNKVPWAGPDSTFYENFDDSDGLVFWEATVQMSSIPFVSGKVNSK